MDEFLAEAKAGIADAEAGRYITIAAPEDVAAFRDQSMARLRGHDRMLLDRAAQRAQQEADR